MTLVDGRQMAAAVNEQTKARVAALARPVVLTVIACNPNPETVRYLALKERTASWLGIGFKKIILDGDAATAQVVAAVAAAKDADGVLVQLPLPPHINTTTVLSLIPPPQDLDGLNPHTTLVFSPVVAAMIEIIKTHDVPVVGQQVVVVGSGRLVGQPAARWFIEQGALVSVVTKDTVAIARHTSKADILVLGAGVPGLVTVDMVKSGVVVLDAGTSEDGGVLRGDADPQVASVAALFTPVPGGIGPLTVAALFSNLLVLAENKTRL
jgi:methylenetetrahydrofolate dehydrogenase (NADP+)/methenyltetrahydrofolate cyclohydrolase